MNPWLASISIAILVATVPLSWVLRILRDMPPPVVRTFRRWPDSVNLLVVGVVTGVVTAFIRFAYYGPSAEPLRVGFQFLIASLVYVFAIVLLVRQHVGLYPEYFVTVGASGLAPRKGLYSHVSDIAVRSEYGREVEVELVMRSNETLLLHLPAHHLRTLGELVAKSQPGL